MNPDSYNPQPEQPQQPQPQPEPQPQYQPQPPQPPQYPSQYPSQPSPAPIEPHKRSKRTKLALWLLIGPTVLFVFTLFLTFGVTAYELSKTSESTITKCSTSQTVTNDDTTKQDLFGDTQSNAEDCNLFGESSTLKTATNVFTYLAFIIVFLTWLPGIIIGIVLLVKKPKTTI